jgi:hypothetical protein
VSTPKGPIEGHGNGLSKKEAKAAAAKDALSQLMECDSYRIMTTPPKPKKSPIIVQDLFSGPSTSPPTGEDRNMVPHLNEYCQKKKLQQPHYEDMAKEGSDHMPTFTIRCRVQELGIEATGTARDKKTAKKLAAAAVWDTLQNSSGLPVTKSGIWFNPSKVSTSDSPDSGKKAEPRTTDKVNDNVAKSAFFQFMESDRQILNKLDVYLQNQHVEMSPDYMSHLREFATDLGLRVDYCDLTEQESKHKALLSLLYKDQVVVTSFGSSCSDLVEAKQNAAYRALLILVVLRRT